MSDDNRKLPPIETRFKPGQSGNPGGKPKNARNWLQVNFLKALAEDFEAHGVTAISAARTSDPMGYVRTIASLLPKQVEQTQPLEDVSDAELIAGIALLRSRLAGGDGEGVSEARPPSQIN